MRRGYEAAGRCVKCTGAYSFIGALGMRTWPFTVMTIAGPNRGRVSRLIKRGRTQRFDGHSVLIELASIASMYTWEQCSVVVLKLELDENKKLESKSRARASGRRADNSQTITLPGRRQRPGRRNSGRAARPRTCTFTRERAQIDYVKRKAFYLLPLFRYTFGVRRNATSATGGAAAQVSPPPHLSEARPGRRDIILKAAPKRPRDYFALSLTERER
ncbi:hypothetical protein EVAR_2249_1 [Eumeta japonica]|uniref:Uncharacterized protein n=1 Tax=Eumeta variegata TaxID=151549 RepID=A0A4C1SFJ3_EUMVA|nr:hypothetical protein EVAR_2249_1 [Eumeta japonica]